MKPIKKGRTLDVNWYAVDWSKRDNELVKEIGCAESTVHRMRKRHTKIRHPQPGKTPSPMPENFTPSIGKTGRISSGVTAKDYGVGTHVAERWVKLWREQMKIDKE